MSNTLFIGTFPHIFFSEYNLLSASNFNTINVIPDSRYTIFKINCSIFEAFIRHYLFHSQVTSDFFLNIIIQINKSEVSVCNFNITTDSYIFFLNFSCMCLSGLSLEPLDRLTGILLTAS